MKGDAAVRLTNPSDVSKLPRPEDPMRSTTFAFAFAARTSRALSMLGALALAVGVAGSVTGCGEIYTSTTTEAEETDSAEDDDTADDELVILCDPLEQACGGGESCLPDGRGFRCMQFLEDSAGFAGDECGSPAECRPGLYCNSGTVVAGCSGPGCGAPWCDLERADPCGGSEKCQAWFSGEVPLGGEHIGICAVP